MPGTNAKAISSRQVDVGKNKRTDRAGTSHYRACKHTNQPPVHTHIHVQLVSLIHVYLATLRARLWSLVNRWGLLTRGSTKGW